MKETNDMIVIFGESNKRYDVPKTEIYQVGMNVILKLNFSDLTKYEVRKDSPMPVDS